MKFSHWYDAQGRNMFGSDYTVCPNKKETRFVSEIYLQCRAIFNQTICFVIKGIFSSFIWYQAHDDTLYLNAWLKRTKLNS